MLTNFEGKVGPTVSFGNGNKRNTLRYASIVLGNINLREIQNQLGD